MCEGIPEQVNFLIDEAASTGKGANATISYVHYYLEHHRLGEKMRTFTQTTAQGKIRITIFCDILLGELCCNFTTVSHTPFLLQGIQNLAQTDVLDC